jgi:hypothetical protein
MRLPKLAIVVTVGLLAVAGCDLWVMHGPPDEIETVADEGLVTVLAPLGGEIYHPGDAVEISWTGSINVSSVVIELYRYGQQDSVIAQRAPNTGSLNWPIPADFDTATEIPDEYQISIRAQYTDHYPGDLYIQAFSEAFTILQPSTGGLTDVAVEQRVIAITVTDNGLEIDDDTIDILLNGEPVVSGHVLTGPPGTDFELVLQEGSNLLEIVAVNEGGVSPNTAELAITNVVEGDSVQEWRLLAGERGSLTITAP